MRRRSFDRRTIIIFERGKEVLRGGRLMGGAGKMGAGTRSYIYYQRKVRSKKDGV